MFLLVGLERVLVFDFVAFGNNVPAGAARRDNHLAGTARSRQGRAVVWRGEANPGRRAPFWHPDNIDGRRSGNMFLLVGFEQVLDSRADDSLRASATIDQTDIRGSKPHGHDPSGAASD